MSKALTSAHDVPLIIYGAGGHGKVVLDIARSAGNSVSTVLDDDPEHRELSGVQVTYAPEFSWDRVIHFYFLVAVGNNSARQDIFRRLCQRGGMPKTLIHPFSAISASAEIGRGVSVSAGAVVNPGALVRDNCIINTCASVDHDCLVEEHCHLCPGVRLAGNVTVGAGTMVGTGASILPGIRVGQWCCIGAGAVVNRDLPPGVVAYGVPARIRKRRPEFLVPE